MNLGTILGRAVGIGGGISTDAARQLFGGVLESVLRATSAAAAQGVLRKAMRQELRSPEGSKKFAAIAGQLQAACNANDADKAGDALAAILGEILND